MSREGGSPRKAFIYFSVQCTANTCLSTVEWLWTSLRTCSEGFPWWLTLVSWAKENGRGWRGSENYQKLKNNPERKQKPSSPPRSGKSRGGEFDTVSGSWVGWGGGSWLFGFDLVFFFFYNFGPFFVIYFFKDINFEVRVNSVAPGSSIYSPTASANYGDAFAPFEIAKPGVPAKRLGTTMEVSQKTYLYEKYQGLKSLLHSLPLRTPKNLI